MGGAGQEACSVGCAQMEGRVAHRRESRMSYSQRTFGEALKSVKRHKRTRPQQ
jgi:hypothetical protein